MNTPLEIFEQNLSWADGIARNVHRKIPPSFELADLEQVARLEMWNRCQKFDPESGVPFRGYAYFWVRGAVLMSIRRRNWADGTVDELRDTHLDPRSDIEARILADDRTRDLRRQAEYILAALSRTAKDEGRVLRAIYLADREDWETAKRLRMTPQDLCRAGKRAIRVLRGRLAREEARDAECSLVA